jgi:hypothetical protein
MEELRKQVVAVLAEGYEVANPITHARGRQKLEGSSDPIEKLLVDVIDSQDSQRALVKSLVDDFISMSQRVGAIEDRRGVGALSLFKGLSGIEAPPAPTMRGPLGNVLSPAELPTSATSDYAFSLAARPKKSGEPS